MFLRTINQNKFFIHLSFLLVLSLFFTTDYGQNGVAINTTGAAANGSAILDLSNSVSKGLLMPQVNSTSSVSSPATGLIVYQTGGTPGFYYYNGSTWVLLGSASGNGNYVLNQTTQQLNSNFNISNAGVIGTTLNVGSLSTLTGVSNTGAVTSTGGAISLNAGYAGNVTIGGAGNSTIAIGGTGNSTTNITSGNGGVYINATGNNNITIGNSANDLLLPKFSTANTVLYTAAGGILSGTIGSNDKFLIQRSGVLGFNTILASDLPSLAGNYIQNQFGSAQAGAGFWTAGQGRVDGLLTSSAGITNTGALTSSVGAINLNSAIANNTQATNINAGTGNTGPVSIGTGTGNVLLGTGTGTVAIGGIGPQTINIGAAFSTGPSNTINIGSNGDGSNTTTNIIGSLGVNINTISNRTTTIGSSASPIILIGAAATGGSVSLGSTATTTNLNGVITAINGSPVNINLGNNKATNINTSATSGAVNIGATAAATQAINIGVGVTGTSTITIGNISSDPVTTSILSGTGGVNINKTGTGSVTIGNTTGNLFLPKFATPGTIVYSSAATGQIAASAAGIAGQVLTSGGAGAPTWSSALPSGSSAYIQNQSSSLQSANYWISGPASIGTSAFASTNQLNIETSGSNNNGILSINTAATGTGGGDGVDGFTSQSGGAGLWAANTNNLGTGIMGTGNNQTTYYLSLGSGGAFTGNTTGVFAKNISNGIGEALYTERGNSPTVVRVNYYDGTTQYKIIGVGTVSTVAENTDNKSKVVLHAPEAPEILFEDYGNGELVGGKAHVNIDPIFSKNIVVNDKHPLRVFIQLEGDCNGVYVTSKSKTGFDVVELQKGNSNVTFQWHIVCNRANEDLGNGKISYNEDMRFEQAPKNTQNLSAEKVLQKIKKS